VVAREIEDNRFTIKTDRPGVKVSWQVTGVRKDAYAEAHRIQVEVDKNPEERGKFLHPRLFGAPEDEGIGYKGRKESSLQARLDRGSANDLLPQHESQRR